MKLLVGMVVSNKMQKSVVVAVDRLFHHKLYNRYVKRTSKFMAHDEHNLCNIGDRESDAESLWDRTGYLASFWAFASPPFKGVPFFLISRDWAAMSKLLPPTPPRRSMCILPVAGGGAYDVDYSFLCLVVIGFLSLENRTSAFCLLGGARDQHHLTCEGLQPGRDKNHLAVVSLQKKVAPATKTIMQYFALRKVASPAIVARLPAWSRPRGIDSACN
ncbi:hypothetical protein TEA_017055 [Camellia sinensis var. sinensis]|uniref:Uncharacterized protein n=1 Tax=Camellia sinensis var. sinensis TaxID=542762 RepID=A0A4S4E1F8_CAMSN|nr:hypothetical protein TEA_017055 [Camellia sinensis var. sinensis]